MEGKEPQSAPETEVTKPVHVKSRRKKRNKNRSNGINTMNCRYELVRFTSSKFGMKESSEKWEVYWTDLSVSVQRCKDLKETQRINHFPGMLEICRKDFLARNLTRLHRNFPRDYDFFPKTWCLPKDIPDLVDFAKKNKSICFIIKPDLGSQGKGIAITKNVHQLKNFERTVCQVYIHRPFLMDGYKFDLRIYTLITCCDPLRIYVYNEGLARFATEKYHEPNSDNATNMYMHLTNYSVNKHSKAYVADDIEGSKRKLSTIKRWFVKNNYDVENIWKSVDDVIVKTIIVSVPTLRHFYQECFQNRGPDACFEILGFDLMFDCDMKPYVLEVNHSPSFHIDSTIDHEVKEPLLYDTFKLLNLSQPLGKKSRNEEGRTNGFRPFDEDMEILGNYRMIYPCEFTEYYDKFIEVRQNIIANNEVCQLKVEDTVDDKVCGNASKNKTQSDNLAKETSTRSGATHEPNPSVEEKKIEAIKLGTAKLLPNTPNKVDEFEENTRISGMEQRDLLIKSRGIVETVYKNLRDAGLLRARDHVKFGRIDGKDKPISHAIGVFRKKEQMVKTQSKKVDSLQKTKGNPETQTKSSGKEAANQYFGKQNLINNLASPVVRCVGDENIERS